MSECAGCWMPLQRSAGYVQHWFVEGCKLLAFGSVLLLTLIASE